MIQKRRTHQAWPVIATAFLSCVLVFHSGVAAKEPSTLQQRLAECTDRLVFETYVKDNWDLVVVNADGSQRVNITSSPEVHELYPQVSPDGTRIGFLVDAGSGRRTTRSIWVMDIDGSNRKKLVDYARQPFWSPDNETIGYLPQEFKKFSVTDFFTKGLSFFNTSSGKTHLHISSDKLHHLYNPSFASNGKWVVATVHAGMGHGHSNLLIEVEGDRIINLGDRAPVELAKKPKAGALRQFPGCRPCISPDSKMIAWGQSDHLVCVAELDLDAEEPHVGRILTRIRDSKHKIYHVDWSPGGEFLSLSRGVSSKGDLSKPGTHESACEIVGVYARGWDIFAVPALGHPEINLEKPDEITSYRITHDGMSNKESDWFRPATIDRTE